MSNLFNKLKEADEETDFSPSKEKTLDSWRKRFKEGRAVIYVSLNTKNIQVDTEEEAHALVSKLNDIGVDANSYFYDSTAKGQTKVLIPESIDEKKSKKKAQEFEVIVDVNTKLSKEGLRKFIGRMVKYASARGHKIEIVQVEKKT